MTCHYPDLGIASDWLCREGIFIQPIRSTAEIWAVHVISMEFLRSLLDVVLRGLKWRPRETSAVFSGYYLTVNNGSSAVRL